MPPPLAKRIVSPVLIGRESERDALHYLIAQTRDASGRTVLIAGEAGIGKSRLVGEAVTAALARDFRALQGRCFETDRSLPYAPLLDLLRSDFTNRNGADLRRAFGEAAADLAPLLPELTLLEQGKAISAEREPEAAKRRVFRALRDVILHHGTAARQESEDSPAGGTTGPLLIAIEDLHWCDDLSLEFLLYFARQLSSQPVLLLLTYRSDEVQPALSSFLAAFDRERLAVEWMLHPLSLAETEQMIRAIFEQPRPIRKEFLDLIFAMTEGNPFFVEEILKSLVAAGEIFLAHGIWDRKPLAQLHIPRSVQDAVNRRLEKLSDGAKQVLVLAAVSGRRFDFDILTPLCGGDARTLVQQIKELVNEQLVMEETADRFAFRHALTRQAIYDGLLSRERREQHAAIAAQMERLYAGAGFAEAHVAELAYHFHAAGLWDKAAGYSARAGEKALTLYAPRTAVEHFSRALEAGRAMAIPPPAALLRARGRGYEFLGEFDAACADYLAAEEAARGAHDAMAEWQSLLDLGFLWLERDYQHGGEYFQQALALARRLDQPALIARSLNRVGNWLTNAEQPYAGLRYHQEALELFEGLGDPRGRAETLDLFSAARLMGGDVQHGVRDARQAIALMRDLDDRRGIAGALGICAMRGGSYLIDTTVSSGASMAECIADSEEALSLARQIGWRSGEAATLNILAAILGHFGYFERALQAGEQGLAIATEIGHRGWIVTAHYALGVNYLNLLALPRATEHLAQALPAAKESRSLYLQRTVAGYLASAYSADGRLTEASGILSEWLPAGVEPLSQAVRILSCASAELALAQGEPERALSVLERLIALAANGDSIPGMPGAVIPRLWQLRGAALLALKRPREALDSLQPAEQVAGIKGLRPIRWKILATLGHAYLALGKRVDAADALSGARAVVADLAAGIEDKQLRSNFSRGAHVQIGRTPAVSALSRAKRQFGGLTERERQIAVLIAQGKSNREIAAALVLSHRTIEVHIANIMTKLEFAARTQIAAWAVAQKLVPAKDG